MMQSALAFDLATDPRLDAELEATVERSELEDPAAGPLWWVWPTGSIADVRRLYAPDREAARARAAETLGRAPYLVLPAVPRP